MKLSLVYTIAAIFLILLGLSALLAPAAMLGAAGSAPVASAALMTARFVGVEALGLGIIAWLVRNAEASRTRDAVTLGFTIYFALHALTSLYGQFTDTSTSVHWVMASLQALFAVAFFVAGKASMSAKTS